MASVYEMSRAISQPMCVSTTSTTLYRPERNGRNSNPVATTASTAFNMVV